METWKYFDITHKEHVLCNPTNLEKFAELISLLRLNPGDRVLEIAMGKGEFIVQLAERYGVAGVGVDLSPYCVADARRKLQARAPQADIQFIEMDGADYRPETAESFHLTVCMGASWIFNGHQGTLQALSGMTMPGGLIAVGEPYWRQEPDPAYLQAAGLERELFGAHRDNVRAGEALGLIPLYTIVSSHDDWDRYEGLQWIAAENYALAHPNDPDVPELLARVRQHKHEYLAWGRDTLGWALYLFRKAIKGEPE